MPQHLTVAAVRPPHVTGRPNGGRAGRLVRSRASLGLMFMTPAGLVLAATIVYPLASIFVLSAQGPGAAASGTPVFVGLANYHRALGSSNFFDALTKSFVVTVVSVAMTVALGMLVAVMLNGQFRGRGLARSLTILPWAMPTFVAAFAWRWMLDYTYGALNHVLLLTGVTRMPVWFLGKNLALLMGAVAYTWKGLPWAAMVLLAGLQVVPQELRDAARVDGASAWKEWQHVVLPSLGFVIQITVTLLFVWNFNWFEMMWLLTGGGPGRATTLLPIDVYLQAFRAFDTGAAAALSVIILVILLVVTSIMFYGWGKRGTVL